METDARNPDDLTADELEALAQAIDEDNAAVDWTPERPWMRSFLIAYSRTGNVTRSCERVGISDESVRRWRQQSEQFAIAFARASERAHDLLEETARLWAQHGLETRTIETKTDPDGHVTITEKITRHRSPALMQTLLAATGREKFRRNVRVEQTGPGGGPIEHEVTVVDETVKAFRLELERLGTVPEPQPVAAPGPEAPAA